MEKEMEDLQGDRKVETVAWKPGPQFSLGTRVHGANLLADARVACYLGQQNPDSPLE
jgi:hypothetical protein